MSGVEPLAITPPASAWNSVSGLQGPKGDPGAAGAVGGDGSLLINQVAHGFVVGDLVRPDNVTSGVYVKSLADTLVNSQVAGYVKIVNSVDSFTIAQNGYYSVASPAWNAGQIQYLSGTTPGAKTVNAPTAAGTIVKPVFLAETNKTGWWSIGDSVANPQYPLVKVLKSSTAEQFYSNSTVENEIGRISFADISPQLKNGDRIRVKYLATLINNSGASLSYTFRLQHYNGFTCLAFTFSPPSSANRFGLKVEYDLWYLDKSAQVIAVGQIQINTSGSTQWTATAPMTSVSAANNNLGIANFAPNWGGLSEFHWTVQMLTASGSADIRVEGWVAEMLAA